LFDVLNSWTQSASIVCNPGYPQTLSIRRAIPR
jgi:hypothetical protein